MGVGMEDQWPFRRALSAYSGGTVMDFHHLPLSCRPSLAGFLLKNGCPCIPVDCSGVGYKRRKGNPRRAGLRVLIDDYFAAIHDPQMFYGEDFRR